MDHLALLSHSQREIEARVEFSLSAFAAGLATDPGHRDQGADEQGFLVDKLGQTGSHLALLCRKGASVAHHHLLLSDIYTYIRQKNTSQAFSKCEFAQNRGFTPIDGNYGKF
jgi:hypothetical protein